MGKETETVFRALRSLIGYAKEKNLLDPADELYARNTLIALLKMKSFEEPGEKAVPFPECLNELTDHAVRSGLIDDTVTERDLFDTKLMGALMPRPSEVSREFRRKYEHSKEEATDYFYALSRDCNYIRRDRIARDLHWEVSSPYGPLEISINLSKPEKDPKAIAAAKLEKSSGYPKCQLCIENEGYEGTLSHPARENLRIIPLDILGERWGFQYSPYVYYNEHCIVMNSKHVPMVIDERVFGKLFAFVEQFPHYFLGSNADLPIVGGSILTHEHFQGGRHSFPMERAETDFAFSVKGFDRVSCAVLKYPMSVIRLNSADKAAAEALAGKILCAWRGYSDPDAFIFAETEGERHNTITPIARMNAGNYELDLVLRNNITTPEHPSGLYHPHGELHHIKRENIGLIEVMGLAILPGRLKTEMAALKEALLSGTDPESVPELQKHAAWAREFMARRGDWSPETADRIIEEEIGRVFTKVLECAGVYKRTEEGRKAFRRFIGTLND